MQMQAGQGRRDGMEQRISLVTLGVKDVAASRQFYERLGWKASSASGSSIAFFQLGGMAMSLYGREALAQDFASPGATGRPGAVTLAQNCATKGDVDATLAEAERAGAKVLKPAGDAFWGGYSGYFADPDGHPWEVAWNPHMKLLADGSAVWPA
jgi:predicted lactoylglutathione lyase